MTLIFSSITIFFLLVVKKHTCASCPNSAGHAPKEERSYCFSQFRYCQIEVFILKEMEKKGSE